MPRLLATAIFVLFTGLSLAPSAMADTGPAEFVRALGNEALGVIRADMPAAQKQAFFHQLLEQNFDLPGIARFVLGPHWRTASEPEKQEFLRLFEDYIVRVLQRAICPVSRRDFAGDRQPRGSRRCPCDERDRQCHCWCVSCRSAFRMMGKARRPGQVPGIRSSA
jgi:phospholipid transport system substrate-binding protein